MKVKLIPVYPSRAKRRIVLYSLPATFGRSPEASVCLEDTWVSRWHCEIAEKNGELVVRDLESRNGTFVNGSRVAESRLRSGDRLTIGSDSYQVRYRGVKVQTPPNGHRGHGPDPDDESAHAYVPF